MKLILFAIALFCIITITSTTELSEDFIQSEWAAFKTKHERNYPDQATEAKKFEAFKATLQKVTEHNKLFDKGEVSYSLGINQFSDLTEDEWKNRNHGLLRPTL